MSMNISQMQRIKENYNASEAHYSYKIAIQTNKIAKLGRVKLTP